MAFSERMEKTLEITKRFVDEMYYIDEDNVDIFKLFNIDRNQDNQQIIEDFENIHKYFHPDMIKQIPQEYQYAYYIISNEIVPTLNFQSVGQKKSNSPLRERKDKIDKYQELKKYKTKDEIERINEEAKKKYLENERIFLIKNNRINLIEDLDIDEIMQILIKCSSNYYKKINDIENNYYYIFDLNQNLSNEEIINGDKYKKLVSVFVKDNSHLIDDYYKNAYEELKKEFDKFDFTILHNNNSESINKKYNYKYNHIDKCKLFTSTQKRIINSIEKSIIKNGITKTIELFTEFLEKEQITILPDNIADQLYNIPPKTILKILRKKFGNLPSDELIESSINYIITKKINLLKKAIIITYDKYNIEQARYALFKLITENDSSFFARKYKKNIGRELLLTIYPKMLKIILGVLLPEKLEYLIDNPQNEITNYDHDTNEELLTILLNDHIIDKKQGLNR